MTSKPSGTSLSGFLDHLEVEAFFTDRIGSLDDLDEVAFLLATFGGMLRCVGHGLRGEG